MNEAQVTMTGYVASAPRLAKTKGGRFVTNMRVGVTPRLQDKQTGQWSDGETSYVTVTCWRSLAANTAACLRKGDPVVVKGRMRVREYGDKDGNQRLAVEVDASTLGHDLTRGVAHFLRTKRPLTDPPDPLGQSGADDADGADGADGAGGRPGAPWLALVPGEPEAGSEELPDDEFSTAEMLGEAEIEAPAGHAPAGGDAAGTGAGAEDRDSGDAVDPEPGAATGSRTGSRYAGAAAV